MIKSDIKPLLIDFDGVIKVGEEPAEDAAEFLKYVSDEKIPAFILSNSTLRTSDDLLQWMRDHDLDYDIPAMTTVDASLVYVQGSYNTVSVYVSDQVKGAFRELDDDKSPDAVLVGDLGEDWNYEKMNEIFRKVYYGSTLIAMQKNRHWRPDGRNPVMDAGSFISAIEYAAQTEARLIGKPSPLYFYLALNLLGFEDKNPFIIIGDDIETDITAAQKLGGTGILVYTGKTTHPLTEGLSIKPDFEAFSLKDVIHLLRNIT